MNRAQPSLLLLAAPPVSAALWPPVQARLSTLGFSSEALELFTPAPEVVTIDALAAQVATAAARRAEPVIIVGHGTATPIAWRAAQHGAAGLVLSNGPVGELPPLTRAMLSAFPPPQIMSRTLLSPRVWQRWLRSSVGLRRLVNNPYVMDRDTVVTVSKDYLSTSAHRLAVAHFFRELLLLPSAPPSLDLPSLLLWGNHDVLFPASITDEARLYLSTCEHRQVAGGRYLHPAERPWEMADAIAGWVTEHWKTAS